MFKVFFFYFPFVLTCLFLVDIPTFIFDLIFCSVVLDDEPKTEKSSIEFMLMTRRGNKQQVTTAIYILESLYRL